MRLLHMNLALLSLLLFIPIVSSQDSARVLPKVIEHAKPVYAMIPLTAHVQGEVRLKITTDGESVVDAVPESGPALLYKTSVDNVRTWKFVKHEPGEFRVVFRYGFIPSAKVTLLQSPGVVDIAVFPPEDNDNRGERLGYTVPKSWDLELKTATDTLTAPLTMWTYGAGLRGYTLGQQKQERGLGNAHIEGDILGFDSALDDSHGQRLQFSLLGRKAGERLEGIFLDAWGASGTWRATPSIPPAPTCEAPSAAAEQNVIPVPEISQHSQPSYPSLAWEAQVEGQVRMRVSADNYCVAKITTQSGDPLLAEAAEANVRTWLFDSHSPGTFDLTFNYRFLRPTISFLEKPGVVEVWEIPSTLGGSPFGPVNYGADEPEIWKAQLTSPRGHVRVTIQFPYGCCEEGDVTDAKHDEKETIEQGHNFEDELGFSTTVKMSNNQRTKVSLIGRRRSGDRIQGVFLDESGARGTWSARVIHHGLPPTYE
jgi:hypothetical protein